MVYTLALKYLYRDYFKANVYTVWVHGPSGQIGKDAEVEIVAPTTYIPNPRPQSLHPEPWTLKPQTAKTLNSWTPNP